MLQNRWRRRTTIKICDYVEEIRTGHTEEWTNVSFVLKVLMFETYLYIYIYQHNIRVISLKEEDDEFKQQKKTIKIRKKYKFSGFNTQ